MAGAKFGPFDARGRKYLIRDGKRTEAFIQRWPQMCGKIERYSFYPNEQRYDVDAPELNAHIWPGDLARHRLASLEEAALARFANPLLHGKSAYPRPPKSNAPEGARSKR